MKLGQMLLALVAAVTLCLPVSCAKAPPNLTPQAVTAFHATQVIHALDHVRDVADAAHKTSPPLLNAATTLKIVNWHQATIKIVHDAPQGWVADTLSGLDQLKKNLSPHEQSVIGPYIDAAKLLIQEVTK